MDKNFNKGALPPVPPRIHPWLQVHVYLEIYLSVCKTVIYDMLTVF